MARGDKWSQWAPSGASHTHCWARQCCLMECKYAPLTCPLTSTHMPTKLPIDIQ